MDYPRIHETRIGRTPEGGEYRALFGVLPGCFLLDAEYLLDGASDHGVFDALYLHDPDGNGAELYWDRPREAWTHDGEGNLALVTQPLDARGLLADLDGGARGE